MPGEQWDALKAIDTNVLNELIDQCLYEKRIARLRSFGIESCGPYAASHFRMFERAIAEYGGAKASKKVAETEIRARRAGSDLARAIDQMKRRLETEEEEGQLFYIDDQILPPRRFSEHLTVRVSYRWRSTVDARWEYGHITFIHDVDLRPDYSSPAPKRKRSPGKREHDRQDKLYREWEQLANLGLHSVRDYFREGGSAAAIPEVFRAKPDSHSRGLNNFSARFWSNAA